MRCVVYQLGLIEYGDAYHLQRKLLEGRLDGGTADALLLLEHPPTITVGKSGKLENVLASPAELARMQEQMAKPAWYQWADEKGVREAVDTIIKALGL